MRYEQLDPNLPNLKYGRLNEPVARTKYETILTERGHQNVKIEQCDLCVHPEKVFLGASPDALVHCSCCGDSLLEIKCPRSIVLDQPTADNIPVLEARDGKSKLRENHAYYYQVQAQMGVTGRNWVSFIFFPNSSQISCTFTLVPIDLAISLSAQRGVVGASDG